MSTPVAIAIKSAPTTFSLTTFPKFPRLPPELRIMIWKLALYRKPRVIVASKMSRGDFDKEPEDDPNLSFEAGQGGVVETFDTSDRVFAVDSQGRIVPVGCTWDARLSDYAIPTALLHTCRESRQQALKTYEVSFEGFESSSPGSSSKYVYFDWSRDVLLVDDARAWESFCGRDLLLPNSKGQTAPLWFSKIQHLKLSCGFTECLKLCEDLSIGMTALKTISILGYPCLAHSGLTSQCAECGMVERHKDTFKKRLESTWEQKLDKKSLPYIDFLTWDDCEEILSRNEIDFQEPRRRNVAIWEDAE